MKSQLLRPAKACLRHVPVLSLCVGALFFSATPAFSQLATSASYNNWRWSGLPLASSSTASKTPTSVGYVSRYVAPAVQSLIASKLAYSEIAGTGSFGGGTATLSGLVFCDSNNDGIVGPDEWGIGEARIALTKEGSSDQPLIALSARDGSFTFAGLSAGNYTVTMLTPSSVPGKDTLGVVQDKSGNLVPANAGTASTDVFSGIILEDGYAARNYAFAETSYPVELISKRLMLASSTGGSYAHTDVVPEPGTLALLAMASLSIGLLWLRGRAKSR